MKIGIIGASGKAGQLILQAALRRGHTVTAIVRHPEKVTADVIILKRDIFELTQADLLEFDVVVDAFNAPQGQEALHQTSLAHLVKLLTGTPVRLMVVGGAGSLYVDAQTQLSQTPDFPAAFKPTADNMRLALADLQQASALKWTYISPAPLFQYDGPKTSHYLVSDAHLISNDQGQSQISYADYAEAFVDEIEQQKHLNQQMSVIAG